MIKRHAFLSPTHRNKHHRRKGLLFRTFGRISRIPLPPLSSLDPGACTLSPMFSGFFIFIFTFPTLIEKIVKCQNSFYVFLCLCEIALTTSDLMWYQVEKPKLFIPGRTLFSFFRWDSAARYAGMKLGPATTSQSAAWRIYFIARKLGTTDYWLCGRFSKSTDKFSPTFGMNLHSIASTTRPTTERFTVWLATRVNDRSPISSDGPLWPFTWPAWSVRAILTNCWHRQFFVFFKVSHAMPMKLLILPFRLHRQSLANCSKFV